MGRISKLDKVISQILSDPNVEKVSYTIDIKKCKEDLLRVCVKYGLKRNWFEAYIDEFIEDMKNGTGKVAKYIKPVDQQ